ncbi:MAG TPA: hypothetical protein VLE95_02465 [Chlamydiales bacterium]|nr:hypothetical protein [Chlamydiales bacterium]
MIVLRSSLLPSKAILFFLWLFLLVFPKGGFKIGAIPITWGYVLLGIVSLFSLFRNRYMFHNLRFSAFLFTIPFQIISIISFIIHGVADNSLLISFLVSLLFLPWIFYLFLSEYIDSMNLCLFLRLVKTGVLFVSSYGIALFIIKLITGKLIEIPFLTVNYHDYGEVENKCNNRGSVFKLISTYNNGNIYGICILMLLPLYQFLESSRWKKTTVFLSLILSFSRTVWAGLIFSEIIASILLKKKNIILKLLTTLAISLIAILSITFYFGFDFSFLFDVTMGGRVDQLESFSAMHLFPIQSFSGINEIVYFGILSNFGIVGLLSFVAALTGPILFSFSYPSFSPIRQAILCGLINYLFLSLSDGALLLIPVLVFYWFLSALILRQDLYPK